MQTTDLIALAHRLGWADDSIILYIENRREDGSIRSASGRLRIDQREGLQALMDRVERDEIGAVIVFLEDRLFRDETGIQYNTFIDACRKHDVRVITPHYTYDFNRRRFDVRIFREKCDQAADFIKDYVQTRLHGGLERVALRGEYDGRQIPMGYTVRQNKFAPYEPHAEVVRRLFQRFKELNGNFPALLREVEAMPVLFPEFADDVTYRNKIRTIRVAGGYKPSRDGLRSILTNVAYIGWWVYKGEVISKDNHQPIVDEELFWWAFNRLSNVTPEGEPIERTRYRPSYTHRGKPAVEALLRDVITSPLGSVRVQSQNERYPSYVIYESLSSRYQVNRPYSIIIQNLDRVFVERLFQVARHMRTGEDILAAVKRIQEEKQKQLVSVDAQIAAADREIAGAEATLRLPPDVLSDIDRANTARRLKSLRETKVELEAKKREAGSITREEELAEVWS
jgi:hypothetical protein